MSAPLHANVIEVRGASGECEIRIGYRRPGQPDAQPVEVVPTVVCASDVFMQAVVNILSNLSAAREPERALMEHLSQVFAMKLAPPAEAQN